MAVGDIGKRFKEAREKLRPVPSQTTVASALGISQGRLGNWERGAHDPPPEIIQRAVAVLKQSIGYFYGENVEKSDDTQTGVYYNGDITEDRQLDTATMGLIEAIADSRTVRISVPVIDGGKVWSLKGCARTPINMFAYLISGFTSVKLGDDSNSFNFDQGTVPVFKNDDYAHLDTYLLVQSVTNPDLHSVRYIDANGDPKDLLSDDPKTPPLRLGEWRPVGFMYAEVQGAGKSSPRVVIRPDGFGPSRR